MRSVLIHHRTRFDYHCPVALGDQRLLLRPRTGIDLSIDDFQLALSPSGEVHWSEDVLGNIVAVARFSSPTTSLTIDATSRLRSTADAYPVFDLAADAARWPLRYDDDEAQDLRPFTALAHAGCAPRVRQWAQALLSDGPSDTLTLLRRLNDAIGSGLQYEIREDEGTQTPSATLERGVGACRDFAVLFAEAVRGLGLGARLVSGYLCDDLDLVGSSGAGSTHAWAQVFLPGAGWVSFDPTNQRMGDHHLVPVAVAHDLSRIMPVTGRYAGPPDALRELSVEVTVSVGAAESSGTALSSGR